MNTGAGHTLLIWISANRRSIEFVRVLEIFFPYSLQVNLAAGRMKIFLTYFSWRLDITIAILTQIASVYQYIYIFCQLIVLQTHPTSFPGQAPTDCPRDTSKVHIEEERNIITWSNEQASAQRMKCSNADHPDIHGHYRQAEVIHPHCHLDQSINIRIITSILMVKNWPFLRRMTSLLLITITFTFYKLYTLYKI